MKKAKKALLLALCAVLLVGATIAGTVAYLTSTTQEVKNTFTAGNVTITLDEAKVDEYGVEVANAARVTENKYKLIPGHTYTKDPTIHIKGGSEACYLFVKVTNGLANIEGSNKIHDQILTNGWVVVDEDNGIYGKVTALDAREIAADKYKDVAVFGELTIADTANVASYTTATINVQACAIQADGFKDMNDAWTTGFGSVFPTN